MFVHERGRVPKAQEWAQALTTGYHHTRTFRGSVPLNVCRCRQVEARWSVSGLHWAAEGHVVEPPVTVLYEIRFETFRLFGSLGKLKLLLPLPRVQADFPLATVHLPSRQHLYIMPLMRPNDAKLATKRIRDDIIFQILSALHSSPIWYSHRVERGG